MTLFPPRTIRAREIPVPTTVSHDLAFAIAQPTDDRQNQLLRAPKNRQAWSAYLRELDGLDRDRIKALRERFPVDVRTEIQGGVHVRWISKSGAKSTEDLLVHIHGGAYVAGAGESGIGEAILMTHHSGLPVVSIDYRMPPEHPFPTAVEDCVAVWSSLVQSRNPETMAFFGTSTGGALVLSTVIHSRDLGLPLPAAVAASTPWSDLTETGDSYFTNRFIDCAVPFYDGLLAAAAQIYAGPDNCRHPLASPVYANVTGLPPTVLITGTRDLFLSCTVRMHRALRQAGVLADLHVFEGISHGQLIGLCDSEESREAFGEVTRFFKAHMNAKRNEKASFTASPSV